MAAFNIDAWQTGLGQREELTLEGTCFESYWNDLPKGSKFDGFSFQGRMAMLKYLIYELDEPSEWIKQKNFWAYHWLWGYASQLDWQQRSGRLSIGLQGDNDDRISTKSWWGYINFCFIVCILLGAEKAGLTNDKIELDDESKELIERDEVVRTCIDNWAELFRVPYSEYKDKVSNCNMLNNAFAKAGFDFRKETWKAHTAVIYATVGTDHIQINEMLHLLPEPEQNFGLGFCRMVELLAALCFPTDLRTLLNDGAGYLPLEVVTDEKLCHWKTNKKHLAEPDRRRLASVETTHKLVKAPERALHMIAKFYQVVVQTPEIAESMPNTIVKMEFGTTQEKFQHLMRLLALFSKPFVLHLQPRGGVEWSLAASVLLVTGLAIFRG